MVHSTCATCGGPVYRYHADHVPKFGNDGQDCWHLLAVNPDQGHLPIWTPPAD